MKEASLFSGMVGGVVAIILIVIFVCMLFGSAREEVKESHDAIAKEAERESKPTPGYVTGSLGGDTGCLLLLTILAVVILAAFVGTYIAPLPPR
jgi:hypothetical protein